MLSIEEMNRYSRHFNLPDFSFEEQHKLQHSKVLVIGAGGLGCPLLLYLAAAGVGTIGIVDPDIVDLSNLQRQVLYTVEDIGELKVERARYRLLQMNPHITINIYPIALDNSNAIDIISQYDIIADGTDNFPTRYLINDACVLSEKPNVFASIFRYEGQIAVFNALLKDHSRSGNYRDLYPTPPPAGMVPDCATAGVLGVVAGIIGTLQGLEVIKLITDIGTPLINQVMHYDALSSTTFKLKYSKRSDTKIDSLINYEHFCNVNSPNETLNMSAIKEITVQELKKKMDNSLPFQLIDVREPKEYEFTNLNGELIPMGNIIGQKESVRKDVDVIIMCRSGQRSAAVIDALQKFGFDNLYNLKGGILAWSREIDNSIPQY